MYQDENNLYHYQYQDDNQPGQSFEPDCGSQSGQQPVQEMKPVKKNRAGMNIRPHWHWPYWRRDWRRNRLGIERRTQQK